MWDSSELGRRESSPAIQGKPSSCSVDSGHGQGCCDTEQPRGGARVRIAASPGPGQGRQEVASAGPLCPLPLSALPHSL